MLFPSFSGIFNCSGYLDLDSLGVIFISLYCDIDQEILAQLVDLEFSCVIDWEIVTATGISIGRP